jgi:predicted type IV restriction endonuclease
MEWDEATKALINDVAEQAADKTVVRTMTSLGVDVSNPLEVQADFQFIRGMRSNWNSVKSRSIFMAVGLMITGFFTFLWAAVRASFTNGPS